MITIQKLSLAALVGLCAVLNAGALTINPSTTPQFTGTDNSNLSDSQISTIVGVSGLTTVYKQDQGGSEGGTFATSYTTTFLNSPSDPSGALIDYIGGASITGGSIFLYVKDGNSDPAYYIFDITDWDGKEDLLLEDFWPKQGAISHVAILTSGGTSVPDGGTTVALLGAALSLLGLVRRHINA
jgi:hypothetical protein